MEIITRKDALEKKLPRYFTGKPCKHGHIAERLASNWVCVECSKLYSKEEREQNPFHVRQRANRWYAKNKAHVAAYIKRTETVAKKEKSRQRAKKYYEANKAEVLVKQAARYKQNIQLMRERSEMYRKKNKNNIAIRKAARKRRVRKATPAWASLKEIYMKYQERKAISIITGVPHHVDHIVPLQGKNVCGLHVPWNLQVIPAHENLCKSNKFGG